VLVEDSLSAMRLVEFDSSLRTVAILGTGVNAEKVREIQRASVDYDEVMIALDADATGQAFTMARKWGNAFRKCRVIVLSKDIKDSSDEELASLPL
jgi:DNA primase